LADLNVPFAYVPDGNAALLLAEKPADRQEEPDQFASVSVSGLPPERREYVRELTVRNRTHVLELKRMYGGRCQISGEQVLNGVAGDLTEAHHIRWLTRGGLDHPSNMVVLSPQFHAAIHAADAQFDWERLRFIINGSAFPLRLNEHLRRR
jgi:predicted restriction endonuclease